MGQYRLDPGVSAEFIRKFRQLRLQYALTAEQAVNLGATARWILKSRIQPTVSLYDPSISPENCCEGISPILDAILRQVLIDAVRVAKISLATRN
jgi:hypothetical protein